MTYAPADDHQAELALTLEQRAALTSGASTWRTTAIPGVLPALLLADGPHGIRHHAGGDHDLGIGTSRPATCFPPAVGLGSSWNPDLARRVGAAIGREARAFGVHVVLGPGLNLKRSPLCGRNFEYVSEDPHLTAAIGAALVEGIQSQRVGATVKHFAVNNQETDRMRVSAEVDERTLRELYLHAFEQVVRRAAPFAVMSAYNRINGVYASEDPWLLTTVLREEWGFTGLVMSDWGAVNDRVTALQAGLDLEMPPTGTDGQIVDAVRSGELDEAALDRACARLATLAGRVATEPAPAPDLDEHDALARAAAAESMVLLKNEGRLLPLDPTASIRIAVVGEFARTPRFQGGGSSRVVPTRLWTALEALTGYGSAARIEFAPGFALDGEPDPTLADAAASAVAAADVALVFLGLPEAAESEGADRTGLDLPDDQLALLTRLAGTDTPVAVILANGSVVSVEPWQHQVEAVLESWLLGQAGGAAVADVVFGALSPSGRLTETVPLRLADTPSYLHFPGARGVSVYGEGRYVGYRHYDTLGVPVAYPFGHGLTYGRFEYADAVVAADGDGFTVGFTVTNTGDRAAAEVAQVYVAVREECPTRPVHELRGFAKVFLEPGGAAAVRVPLSRRDFAIWDVATHAWSVPAGDYVIEIGASSRDVRLRVPLPVDADPDRRELTAMSTVAEWLGHPLGAAHLGRYLSAVPAGVLERAPELRRMVEQMPLAKLSTFGLGLDAAAIAGMVGAVRAGREP